MLITPATKYYKDSTGCLRINCRYVDPKTLRKENNEEVLRMLKLGQYKEEKKCGR